MSGAKEEVLHATIRAVDDASATLAHIRQNIKAVEHATMEASAAERRVGTAETFSRIRAGWGGVTQEINRSRRALLTLAPAFGSLAAFGSVSGLIGMTRSVADMTIANDSLSKAVGMSMAQLAPYKIAAKETGVEFEAVAKTMGRLQRTIGDAASGKNKQAAAFFRHIGVDVGKMGVNLATAEHVMPLVAEALRNMENGTERNDKAFMLLGKSALEVMPILELGQERLKELGELAGHFGFHQPEEAKKSLREYHESLLELDIAVGGFKTALAGQLAPVLTPIIHAMAEWTAANRNWLAAKITEDVKWLGAELKKIDWADLKQKALDLAQAGAFLGEHLDALRYVIEGLAAIMAFRFVAALFAPLAGMGKLGLKVVKLTGLFEGLGTAAAAVETGVAASVATSVAAISSQAFLLAGLVTAAELLRRKGVEMSTPKRPYESDEDHEKRVFEAQRQSVETSSNGPGIPLVGSEIGVWLKHKIFGPDPVAPPEFRLGLDLRQLRGLQIPPLLSRGSPPDVIRSGGFPEIPSLLPIDPWDGHDPHSGLPGYLPAFQRPPDWMQNGRVTVDVNINGVGPGGATVSTDTTGNVRTGDVNIGRNSPMGEGWSH